jgi:hypothetical protein
MLWGLSISETNEFWSNQQGTPSNLHFWKITQLDLNKSRTLIRVAVYSFQFAYIDILYLFVYKQVSCNHLLYWIRGEKSNYNKDFYSKYFEFLYLLFTWILRNWQVGSWYLDWPIATTGITSITKALHNTYKCCKHYI